MNACRLSHPRPTERCLAVLAQAQVLGEREGQHEADAVTVLRYVSDAGSAGGAHSTTGDVGPIHLNPTGCWLADAGDRLDELSLAVPIDSRERDDLAASHGQVGAAHRLEAAVVERMKVLHGENRGRGLGGLLLDAKDHVAANHQPRQRLLGGACSRDRTHRATAAQHRHAVGDLKHLAQLV